MISQDGRLKREKEALKTIIFCEIICLFYKPFISYFAMSVKDSIKVAFIHIKLLLFTIPSLS